MNLIDTHFHLDLYPNSETVVREIEQSKIYTIAVTNTPSVFEYTYKLTEKLKFIRAAIGLHPELALQRKAELPLFKKYLAVTRFVGEIGLDYGNLNENEKHQQRKIFGQILENCAMYSNKVLSVHSRGTASDVISAVGNNYPGKVILHWFSGSMKELEKAVEFGYYFSINSAMASSVKGKKIILGIPNCKMLTETDGPFITNKNVPVLPSNISETISIVAALKQVDKELVKGDIFNNFKRLLL